MRISEELERLQRLYSEGALTKEEFAQAKKKVLLVYTNCIRRQSARKVFGLPLWAIATGPDAETGEMRGHARAVFAFGDTATGFVAVGGFARGIVAIGGGAVGLLAIGGGALGVVALGGGALGGIAVGGGAIGYYAFGGGAAGVHVLSSVQQDPAAVTFFSRFFPVLRQLLQK